jgi:tryptophan 2,3-dioxygenase
MAYLATEDNFNNREFTGNFRDNLSPASGFQSAQFRLIQRGLGKSYLLEIRLFPADAYLENYLGLTGAEIRRVELEAEHAGLLSVIDRLILQEDAPLASPAPDSPLFPVSVLDDLAHKVLGKIAISATPGPSAEEAARDLPRLPQDESSIESLVAAFKEGLTTVLAKIKQKKSLPPALSVDERRLIEKRGAVFRKEWAVAVARENQRRGTFETACLGAGLLLQNGHGGYLRKILDSLNEADEALSGRFLLFHQHLVARRLGEVPGTAGGGAPFLEFFRTLAQRFPALIALRAAREKL